MITVGKFKSHIFYHNKKRKKRKIVEILVIFRERLYVNLGLNSSSQYLLASCVRLGKLLIPSESVSHL